MKAQFLIAELLNTPWSLRREVLASHAQVLARWAAGGAAGTPNGFHAMDDDDDGQPRISAFEARRREANNRVGGGGIAVIPVIGTIVQRAGMMTEWCGGSSTQQVSAALRDAMADDTVAQILMEFDGPGGSVYGIAELGDEINQAKKTKPIVGAVNSCAASAHYWVASQCSELYCTPGGEVGSIGVWTAHEDWSKAYAEAGVNVTLISAGKHKVDGNPYAPLTDEAKAFMQSRVDDYYNAFVRAVARGRGVGVDAVRRGMGEGRVLGADAALAEKMIDGVATIGDVVKNMQKNISRPASRNARTAAENELRLLGA